MGGVLQRFVHFRYFALFPDQVINISHFNNSFHRHDQDLIGLCQTD